jgi:molybdopterin-guanine dinucleotide biosynthesis protein A
VDAIVLAGGRGARLGGRDKAALVVGGRSFLELVVDAVGGADRIVVVGVRRPIEKEVVWVREEPLGGGPVAALEAGLRSVSARLVAVVAVDLPYLEASHIAALEDAAAGHDGAIFVDEHGRDQPLAGVYETATLRIALAGLPSVAGASMRDVVRELDLARAVDTRATRDCDTPEDVAEMGVDWTGGDHVRRVG